jgi:hypothetical protein
VAGSAALMGEAFRHARPLDTQQAIAAQQPQAQQAVRRPEAGGPRVS